jgi:hypothetical protein
MIGLLGTSIATFHEIDSNTLMDLLTKEIEYNFPFTIQMYLDISTINTMEELAQWLEKELSYDTWDTMDILTAVLREANGVFDIMKEDAGLDYFIDVVRYTYDDFRILAQYFL